MKLLFASTDYDRGAGGAAYLLSLVKALVSAGVRVEVLAARDHYIARQLQAANITWHHACFRNVLTPAAHLTLARTLRRMRPDWLLNGSSGRDSWPVIAQGRLQHVPVALFRHSVHPMKPLSARLLPGLAQRFIVSSDFARSEYMARGIPAARVQAFHNCVDTQRFQPDPERGLQLRRELGMPDDAIIVGNVGRTYAAKGVHCLQQALEQAMDAEPRLRALWIGDGPDMDTLRQAICASRHVDRHHLTGWLEDTWRYYNAMSLLAFPTLLQETFGQVCIEAQACGIPVLGSHIGGVPEAMHDGVGGLLLPAGDVVAWRDGILALCDDSKRQRMGKAGRAFVEENFSFSATARSFIRLLTEVPRQG